MIRATTPTQKFYLHTSDVKELLITYKQGEDIILQKTLEDVTFVEGVASFVMSQEETNSFSKGLINVDVRILTEDNVSVASQIFTISARDVLDAQILGDGTKPSVDDCTCTFDCHFDGCECYNAQYEELIKGDKGDTGNGIKSTTLNDDFTLTIRFTDGTSYTTPSIRGMRGERGEQGLKGDKGDTYELTQTDRTDIANIVTTDIIDDSSVANNKVWSAQKINDLRERIEDFENSKMPNVIIHGEPTINGSQMSGFSPNAYAMFPFLVSLTNPFEIRFAFTTGTDVVNQQNILDSDFGLAFAIRNSHFVIALSTNGTSWDLGEGVGSLVVQPMTSYLVKITWDGATYRVSYSRDMGATYTVDITKTSSLPLAPKQMYIGVGESGATVLNSFGGVIDFRYAQLTVNNIITWLGFADIGVLSRLATDLENIDPSGEQKIKDIVNTYTKDEIDASQTEQNNILTELLYRSIDKERSLEYLWKKSKGILFDEETVNSLENTVSVPSGAMEYASLDMLGGNSIKFNQLLDSSRLQRTLTSNGITWTVNDDGTVSANGTATSLSQFTIYNDSKTTGFVGKVGHKYMSSFIVGGSSSTFYGRIIDNGGGIQNDVGKYRISTCLGESGAGVLLRIASGYVANNVVFKPQIFDLTEMGIDYITTVEQFKELFPNDYYPYTEGSIIDAKVDELRSKGTTLGTVTKPIPSQVQSLDGYGIGINDTLYNSLEFTGDKVLFNKRVGSVDLGSLTWSSSSNHRWVSASIREIILKPLTNDTIANTLVIKYTSMSKNSVYSFNNSIGIETTGSIFIRDDSCEDKDSFRSAMNGVMLYYELVEPQVIDVTEYFTEDFNFLQTEANGSIEFHYPSKDDGYELNTHSTVTYMVDVNEVA